MLLGVERVRTETREGFTNTISGTDLIVGARSGSVQLLLYSIFHIGNATNNISFQSYLELAEMRGVEWAVPLSLGDSHRGYRVIGTSNEFFNRYRFAGDRQLQFSAGHPPADLYDAVIGAEVARQLGYATGQSLVIAHGTVSTSILDHADKPFTVSGVLAATGTPLDRAVIVSLEGIEAIHVDWAGGVPIAGRKVDADEARELDLVPESVTAVLVGLTSKVHTFRVQRLINEYPDEPLLAILPGVALQELWRVMSVAERALLAVSILVVLVGISGMMTALLTSLNERRREMAILRSVGARPIHVLILLLAETLFLAAAGILGGLVLVYAAGALAAPLLESRYGIFVSMGLPAPRELLMLGGVLGAAFIAGLVPGYRAYRYSLSDGLSVRV
jgi:putative ABC transport system permease protein